MEKLALGHCLRALRFTHLSKFHQSSNHRLSYRGWIKDTWENAVPHTILHRQDNHKKGSKPSTINNQLTTQPGKTQTDKNRKGTAYLTSLYDHRDLYVTQLSKRLTLLYWFDMVARHISTWTREQTSRLCVLLLLWRLKVSRLPKNGQKVHRRQDDAYCSWDVFWSTLWGY